MDDAVARALMIAPLNDNWVFWGVGFASVALCLLDGFMGVEALCALGFNEKSGSAEYVAPARQSD